MTLGRWGAVAGALCLSACATAPQGPIASPATLSEARRDTLARAVPPPPAPGSSVEAADRERDARTRALVGTDRWLMATAHAELRPALAMGHFDCALGVRSGDRETPALTAVFERLYVEADAVSERVKALHPRVRPVGEAADREACQRLTETQRASPSYPSGSAAAGAAYAEVLAALDPARGTDIRRTGREIGLSRVVCGMHWLSDVAAGQTLGRAVAVEVMADPTYRTMAAQARVELADLRATGRTNPGCAAERRAFETVLP